MAATATVVVSGQVTGGVSGSKNLSASVTSATAIEALTQLAIASGFQSIAVPAGATGCLFTPYSGNVQSLTLKGVTGDTGILLHKTNPTLLCLDPGQATIGITAGGATGGVSEFSWF